VSQAEFGVLVERALSDLPPEFARFVEEVPIEVRDRPTLHQLRGVGLGRDDLLFGLYRGRPRTQRNVEDSAAMPDVIYIFQQPLEQISRNETQLVEQVRKTVLHEIGHHFGMSEEDLEKLGYG
jgi:predicted Zn-dependent protease with MMP-like domain